MSCILLLFFFFSSRRRHTRWPRDWSSDVCSSDLPRRKSWRLGCPQVVDTWLSCLGVKQRLSFYRLGQRSGPRNRQEIGRASCRERGEMGEGAGEVQRKRDRGGEE